MSDQSTKYGLAAASMIESLIGLLVDKGVVDSGEIDDLLARCAKMWRDSPTSPSLSRAVAEIIEDSRPSRQPRDFR